MSLPRADQPQRESSSACPLDRHALLHVGAGSRGEGRFGWISAAAGQINKGPGKWR